MAAKHGTGITVFTDQEGKAPKVVTPADRFPVESPASSVARGNLPGGGALVGFGERDIVSGVADVWNGPTADQPYPPSAGIQMEAVSTSADDVDGGTGVQELELHYLDASGDLQSEIITMNGTTPVQTTATDVRFVQCFHAWAAGSGGAAAGNISLQNVGGGTVYKYIAAGLTRCLSTARMVPRGKTAYITSVGASSSSGTGNKRAITRIMTNALDGEVVNGGNIFFPHCAMTLQNSTTQGDFSIPATMPELSIIKCRATVDGQNYVASNWMAWYEGA